MPFEDLDEAASRDTRIATARDRLEAMVRGLADTVGPRSEYGPVHGELGPDHVLVDRHGRPVLIDIEGLMFFESSGSRRVCDSALASTTGGCTEAVSTSSA